MTYVTCYTHTHRHTDTHTHTHMHTRTHTHTHTHQPNALKQSTIADDEDDLTQQDGDVGQQMFYWIPALQIAVRLLRVQITQLYIALEESV